MTPAADLRRQSDEAFADARIWRRIGAHELADGCAARSDHYADLACALERQATQKTLPPPCAAVGREIEHG